MIGQALIAAMDVEDAAELRCERAELAWRRALEISPALEDEYRAAVLLLEVARFHTHIAMGEPPAGWAVLGGS